MMKWNIFNIKYILALKKNFKNEKILLPPIKKKILKYMIYNYKLF